VKRTSCFRAFSALALTCLAFAYCDPAWALDGTGNVGMDTPAFLAECDKGIEFWCSNQIYGVAIAADLDHMAKNERPTFCLPKRGNGSADERNAKIVKAVKEWFAQHPTVVAQKGDASGPILQALVALWPRPCPS
jgi:hypothetical protein